MLSLKYIIANLLRSKVRAFFTVSTVIVAFFLFGLLLSLDRVFNIGVKVGGADRLLIANKSSIMQPVPFSYKNRIAQLENIDVVAPFVFVGTFFQDPRQQIVTIATEPKSYTQLINEIKFEVPSQKEAWFNDRASVVVGRALAEKYHWKAGDLISLYSIIYPKRDNNNTWTFRVAGIFDSTAKNGNTKSVAIHLDYFNELRMYGQGNVGWYAVRVKDASKAEETGAKIEALFANSGTEIKAGTEEAFTREFMQQVGDFGMMISLALSAVFCTLAMVVANSMAQSVNERVGDLATLKTIGFNDFRLFGLVFAEGKLMIFGGGLLGMALAAISIPFVSEQVHLAEKMEFMWKDLIYGAMAMLAVVFASTFFPALRAMRLSVTEGLARTI